MSSNVLQHLILFWRSTSDSSCAFLRLKTFSRRSHFAIRLKGCTVYSGDTTQLHSTQLNSTELNSTQLNWPSWTAYSQVSRVFVYDVTTNKLSQLLFTLSSWVQLSCVAINTHWRGVYRDTTQLNWRTQLNSTRRREQQLTQFVGRDVTNKNTTDLAVRCSTGSVEFSSVQFSSVEFSWVVSQICAICR